MSNEKKAAALEVQMADCALDRTKTAMKNFVTEHTCYADGKRRLVNVTPDAFESRMRGFFQQLDEQTPIFHAALRRWAELP
jgi:hypothetical protein